MRDTVRSLAGLPVRAAVWIATVVLVLLAVAAVVVREDTVSRRDVVAGAARGVPSRDAPAAADDAVDEMDAVFPAPGASQPEYVALVKIRRKAARAG